MATEDPFVCIAPAVTHTESVGADDAVFEKGCFDNLSNGKVKVSLDSIGVAAALSAPPQFLYASGKRQLTIKPGTVLRKADGGTFAAPAVINLGFAPVAGKDYYVHINNDGTFTVSTTKITDGTASLIGGFHALCADVAAGLTYTLNGAALPHPLAGYVAGDILPASVWCLNHRPYSDPEGMVFIDSLGFWCDIYLMDTNGNSLFQGVIARSQNVAWFFEKLLANRKTLLDDGEFSAAMMGSNEMTSVAGASDAGATTGGAGGRSDTAGRRMISIHGVEEGCGSLWQFIYGIIRNETQTAWTALINKGSHYTCGVVLAGGYWALGARCGSWARTAVDVRSAAHAGIGGRGRSRHAAA